MRKLGSRALAMFLSIIMILSCMSAAFTVLASAADWVYIPGQSGRVAKKLYVKIEQMWQGTSALIGNNDYIINENGTTKAVDIVTDINKSTPYYITATGSDTWWAYTDYIVADSELDNCVYTRTGSGALYNEYSKKYIVNNGTTGIKMSSSEMVWNAGTNSLYCNSGYIGVSSKGQVTLSSSSTTPVYAYRYVQDVYVDGQTAEGGYYKYDGEKTFTVDKGTKFNDAYIRNQISVFYKADSSIPDAEADILDINSDSVTFSWNKTVDTSKIGTYTGTVYVNSKAVGTIDLIVREVGDSIASKADPSTSKIENQFSMTEADDGKMATDKTVRYESDEYGAFGTYENDEFSIALSALGQSFPTVETVESQSVKRNHPDVVFVIDASGSMRVYNIAGGDEICRGEATAKALNEAIKELYSQDPETRIGIVTYNNDYHEAGVYLPLDKYTLPEGQTEYITWDGRMVASASAPAATATSDAIGSFSSSRRYFTPSTLTSRTSAPSTYPYYYVNTSNVLYRYDSRTSSKNLGTLNDGKSLSDGGALTIYRSGNNYYVFETSTFDGVGTAVDSKTYNDLSIPVKTTSEPKTLTNIVKNNNWPGYSDSKMYIPDFSALTKIATTQDGTTYYAYNYNDTYLMVFSSKYPAWPVARMSFLGDNANFPAYYADDYISITCLSPNSISYTVNTYANRTGASLSFEKNNDMMATNFLINSKGETVMPSSYLFVGNQGTYTQSGLKAAENLFKAASDKENRVPSIVLISDGVPTIGTSNTANPPLKYGDSGVSGYGLSTDTAFQDALTDFGLWTIETAMSVKNNVQNMYASGNGNKKALFYTIGPGVDYIMGQTILDPTEENLDKAAAKTTYDDANAESGVGIPSELARKVRAKYSNLDLVDYADWSYSGDMSGQDLINAFKKVVTSLMEVNRPVVSTTEQTEIIGEVSEAMTFTDTIGDGMLLTGDPVVRYNNKNYSHTSKSEKTVDGLKVTTYKYNYQVTETSTNRRYDLNDLTVTVTENKDGTQTVKWFIPSELVPIIVYDYSQNQYISANPIRLVYKVGLTDEAKEEGGVFNTNSTEDKANVEFTPVVGNPYYYENKEGSDGKMHSTLKTDLDKHTEKVDNVTGTDPDSNHQTVDTNTGKITSELGNNGEIEIKYTTIEVTKIWADGNDAIGKRPDNIKVRVYKDGSAYGDVYTLTEKDAISKGKDANGEDIWAFQIKGLPYEEGSVYTINEISISGYDTEIVYKDGQPTITNSRPKARVSYELYLVDKEGTPINDNGETVSFKDRTVKSDIVEINQYLGSTGTIDLDEIEKLLPEGYYIYNPNASYTETYKGNEPSTGSTAKISDSTDTTKVFFPESAKTGSDGTVTGINDYSDVKVAFAIAKKSANVSYELYLVDDKGTPVDDNGNEVTFENRTVKSDLVTVEQYINSTETIDLDELQKILPEGYYIYNPDASYTETYKGDEPSTGSNAKISDSTGTTKVFDPKGTTTDKNGNVTGINDYSDVKVAFAIAKSKAQVAYELYLVDEDGNTIDDNGNPVSFNNRTVKSDLVTVEQYFNTTETIDLDELQKILPEGYYIYNPDASFTETYKGNDPASGSKATIDDATGTTKVFYPDGTTTDKNGNVTGIDDYSSVKVAFAIAQKKANVSYELYLVDENGTPINDNGETVTFENRTVKSDLVTVEQYFNSTETIDLDELQKILPEGYYIYNPNASYTETYKGDDPSSGSNAKVTDSTNTTKVFFPEGTTTDKDGNVKGINDYSDVKVSFAIAQKKANVSYELYLVDENGTPINDNGETVTFENRTVKSDLVTVEQYFNSTETIDLDELQKILPEGYYIYNPDASYTETYKGDESNSGSTAKINDKTDTTKVFFPEGTTTDKDGNVKGINDYSDVKVSFAIAQKKANVSYELYLVDENGTPINDNGETVTFENRTVKSDLVTVEQYFNSTETIDLDELQKILPAGYYIYNPDASYTETYKGDEPDSGSTAKINDKTDTTKVFSPEGTTTDKNGNVTGVTSYNDVKVAFAIAKIAINPDVIVVDYGKTILCSPLDNDNGNSVKIIGVGPVDGTTYSDTYVSQNGVFRIENNNVTFSPFSYMSSINRVKYYVSTVSNDEAYKQLYSTISVIPATTMYYEDNFGGSQANGGLYINYSGEWFTTDGNGNTTAGLEANTDIYDRQDRGEVGQGHTPYGYDSSYDDCAQFSNGTASKVTGTVSLVNGRPQFDASASFEFTGTGFDIISRTDLDCGMITVYVTNSQGKSVNVPVINKGTENLYQIPVISFDCSQYFDKAYDTYTVKINVNAPMAALNISSSVFYLDAIRIYNPMGETEADNKEFNEANDAYNNDHEADAYIASIRDYILQAGKLDETEQFGAVYVDTINNEYTGGGALKPEDYDNAEEAENGEEAPGRDTLDYRTLNQSLIKDFELIGPNEEVYLSPGYGVGFIVESTKKPTTVQLEMKVPSPIKKTASLSVYTYGQKDIGTISITSATEMFYDITNSVKFTQVNGKYRAVVVLENGISAQDLSEIVSITNLKLTYDEDVIALDANDESVFSLDSFDEDNTAVVALKANWNLYEEVFGAVYTHRVAATPDYTINDCDFAGSVKSGSTATVTVKTSQFVDGLVIKDPNGKEVKPESITSTVDDSKLYTEEYKEAKTWTVKFKVYGTTGIADYTFESANGDGNVSVASVAILNTTVSSISVYHKPDKATYKVGERFNPDGMTIKVKYTDGSEKIIGSGFSAEDVKFTKTGTQKVKISYSGAETILNVKVRYSAAQIIATIFGFGWLFKK